MNSWQHYCWANWSWMYRRLWSRSCPWPHHVVMEIQKSHYIGLRAVLESGNPLPKTEWIKLGALFHQSVGSTHYWTDMYKKLLNFLWNALLTTIWKQFKLTIWWSYKLLLIFMEFYIGIIGIKNTRTSWGITDLYVIFIWNLFESFHVWSHWKYTK